MLGPWHDGRGPLFTALADGIAELIDANMIPAGTALPSQRELARQLGISRGTVTSAYELLEQRGRLLTRAGSGSRVRAELSAPGANLTGRLFSFSDESRRRIDLSTGALPASMVTREVMGQIRFDTLHDYLATNGYFPAGLPALRTAIAERLSQDGMATTPDQIVVTSGAQHATSLVVSTYLTAGDEVIVEDPSYRGALETLRTRGARMRSVPFERHGINLPLLEQALAKKPVLAYLQTGVHNPTGLTTNPARRHRLASMLAGGPALAVEDCCSYDLTLDGRPGQTLVGLLPDDRLISIGSLSKLFWGGIRVGWIRTSRSRVRTLLEARKAVDLSTSVIDQLIAIRLLERADEARRERAAMLSVARSIAEGLLHEHLPRWTWPPVDGGAALWIDTGEDAAALAERAKQAGLLISAGPNFSAHGSHRTHLRLPVARDRTTLDRALATIAGLTADRHRRGPSTRTRSGEPPRSGAPPVRPIIFARMPAPTPPEACRIASAPS